MKKSFIFILIALVCLFTACDLELRKDDGGSVFDEIVNEDGFNKGSGTKEDPYVIKTAQQFSDYLGADRYDSASERIYLRLGNDIEVDGSIEYFLTNMELDGDGYTLSADGPYPDDDSKPYRDSGVFRRVDNSTIKNLVYQYNYKALVGVAARGDIVLENVSVKTESGAPVEMTKNNGLFVTYGWGWDVGPTDNDRLTFSNCTNYADTIDSEKNPPYYGIFIGSAASKNEKEYIFESCANFGDISSAGKVGVMIGNVYSSPQSNTKLIIKGFLNEGNIVSSEYASLLTMYESVNKLAEGVDTIIGADKITIQKDPGMSLSVDGENTFKVNLGSLTPETVSAVRLQGVVSLVYFNKEDRTYANSHDVNYLRDLSFSEDSSSGNYIVSVPTKQIIGTHDQDLIKSIENGIATLNDGTIAVYFENPSFLVCGNSTDADTSNVCHKSESGVGGFDRFRIVAYGKSGEVIGSTMIPKAGNGYPSVK